VEGGYSGKQLRKRLSDGHWVVVLGSVLMGRGTPVTPMTLARAASLAAGLDAVVSHTTAGRIWDLRVPADSEAHVIVPRDRRVRIHGLRSHRLDLADSELVVVDGVLCTTLLRTVVDLLLWLPEEDGRALAVDALRRDRLTVDELRHALVRTGQRHGLSRAWSVLADVGRGAHSEAEVKVPRLLRDAGISGWRANVPVHDDAGLIGVVDLLFAGEMLVVEIDGRAFHSDERAFQRDRSRQNRLIALGYRVLRFTWDDLVRRPAEVVAAIQNDLALARARGSAATAAGGTKITT
jgi:very-short-patch-repair endonuclease